MKFHRLTVVENLGIIRGHTHWRMICDCGTEKTSKAAYVRAGKIKSCGCLHVEVNKGPKYRRHSMCNTPTYFSWNSMKSRCTSKAKRYYFGKVTVCKRWQTFANFLADMGERPAGKTLDRIDNAQGYKPENCRWVTAKQQAANRRNNRLLTFKGKTANIAEWATETGLAFATIYARLMRGWSVERSLTTPVAP